MALTVYPPTTATCEQCGCTSDPNGVFPMALVIPGITTQSCTINLCSHCRGAARLDGNALIGTTTAELDCIHCGYPFATGRGGIYYDADLCPRCYR